MRHECSVRAEDLGPYLLGQLDPAEAARVAESVDSCACCAEEVRRLRPVVLALARTVPALEDDVIQAPGPALDRALATMHDDQAASRRRVRNRVALAAAALVLVIASAVGGVVISGGGNSSSDRDVTLIGPGDASGSVVLSQREWGSALVLEVRGLAPGKAYGAWLADESGKRVPAGTFRPTSDGSARLEGAASLRISDAATVGVTELGGDDVLRATVN
jgi:anti-sigma factor RsiW